MHSNPAYRSDDQDAGVAFARQRGFGIMVVTGPDGVLVSHLPFVTHDGALDAHIPRSNPIGRLLRDGPATAMMIVSGPDGYVSPDWYAAEEQVPTWNYVAVHLHGQVELRPPETLRPHIEELSAQFEERLSPKKPWTLDKNSEEGTAKLMRVLLPIRMTFDRVEQTWKLNQTKSEDQRLGAAEGLEDSGFGHEVAELARLMRNV